uniref:Uncharacterized protein n=1 Tax=Manihot esculenta TaxID=3983 RepID=A0A2C9V7X6_MANES
MSTSLMFPAILSIENCGNNERFTLKNEAESPSQRAVSLIGQLQSFGIFCSSLLQNLSWLYSFK